MYQRKKIQQKCEKYDVQGAEPSDNLPKSLSHHPCMRIESSNLSEDDDRSLETCSSMDEDSVQHVKPSLPDKRYILKEVDVESYMKTREMTLSQEMTNAITMIPHFLYVIAFVLSNGWVNQDYLEEAHADILGGRLELTQNEACIDWSSSRYSGWLFTKLHALPPAPVLAVAVGIVLHVPFSFLYHWKYAPALPGHKRTAHWSRRMDQSMLHVTSCCMCLATSGYWDFFLINAIFTADSIYRQFQHKVQPRQNKLRLIISAVSFTLPILQRREWGHFVSLWIVMILSGWVFGKYPIGGWSHSAFHLISGLTIPLLFSVACGLQQSQAQMKFAALCVAMAERRFVA